VESLILTKLQQISQEGFTSSAIEAAINTIEFSLRENNTGSFPRGLSLMLRAVGAWIYDKDPYVPIQWEDALNSFKAKLSKGDVFSPLIEKFLLKNTHRVTVVMLPDSELAKKVEEEEQKRLESERSQMDGSQLEAVVAATEALKERQERPDSPEALTCIPCLQLSDIPKKASKVRSGRQHATNGSKRLPTVWTGSRSAAL
jgi:Zn-dependent M16 (insulinase) family peptidase